MKNVIKNIKEKELDFIKKILSENDNFGEEKDGFIDYYCVYYRRPVLHTFVENGWFWFNYKDFFITGIKTLKPKEKI